MEAIRQMLAMCTVLGLMGGALWWLRRKGVARFSRPGSSKRERKLLLVERLPLSPGHSLHLVSVGDRMLLVASSPGGCALLQVSAGGGLTEGQESAR